MKELIKKLLGAVDKVYVPLAPIPPQMLLTGALERPGLSAELMASDIISRQSEAGAPFGVAFSESNNVAEAMEVIRCQTIIDHLLTNAKIEIVIPPGVPVLTEGANSAGPVVSKGVTTGVASGYGVVR